MKNDFFSICCLIIAGFLISSGCKIGDDEVSRNLYEFSQPVSVSPVKAEYLVGDIINMSVNVPQKTFEDLNTGESITVENARFPLNSRIETVQIEPIPTDTVLFDFILQDGQGEESEDFNTTGLVSMSYGCPEDTYILSFGYQLKSAGNFLIVLNELNTSSIILFRDEGDCSLHSTFPPPDDADQAFVQFTFADPDVNLDVFEAVVQNQNIPNYSYYRSLLDSKAAFFLKVR